MEVSSIFAHFSLAAAFCRIPCDFLFLTDTAANNKQRLLSEAHSTAPTRRDGPMWGQERATLALVGLRWKTVRDDALRDFAHLRCSDGSFRSFPILFLSCHYLQLQTDSNGRRRLQPIQTYVSSPQDHVLKAIRYDAFLLLKNNVVLTDLFSFFLYDN